MAITITGFETHGAYDVLLCYGFCLYGSITASLLTTTHPILHPDVRFPTSLTGDGTDAMNTDCDYSAAYVTLRTSSPDLVGHGMTFTIGRGNDIVCAAIGELAKRIIGRDVESMFGAMGEVWDWLAADSQLRWYVF